MLNEVSLNYYKKQNITIQKKTYINNSKWKECRKIKLGLVKKK